MLDDKDYYDREDEEESKEESFAGFSIVDESGIEVSNIKRIVEKSIDDDEPTIATPIPENEMIVILENAHYDLPTLGQDLEVNFDNGGSVFFNGTKIGDFKPAFLTVLRERRNGQFCTAKMHSTDSPVMVKLFFHMDESLGGVKI